MKEDRDTRNLILLILLLPVYLVARIIPSDKKLYLFGSALGRHLADNSKYLFLYASDHIVNVRAVFISQNRQVVERIRASGRRAEYLYSLKAIWFVIRAKRCFLSHKIKDIRLIRIGKAEIIQLWHGTPLKKINYDVQERASAPARSARRRVKRLIFGLFPYLESGVTFDTIIASSEAVCPSLQSGFRIPREKIFVGGQPRNDCLMNSLNLPPELFPETALLSQLASSFQHRVVWMPTHRAVDAGASMNDLLDRFGFDDDRMTHLLERNRACFVIKAHFIEQNNLRERFAGSDRILVYNEADPYPLVRMTSVLITDYSSIIFDFALLDRPMIFAPFDLKEYCRNTAEFYYDYDEVTPGPKCNNWLEVEAAIERAIEAPGEFGPRRHAVRDRFNAYAGGACKRIADKYMVG